MICQTTVIVFLDRIINNTSDLPARIFNFINAPFPFLHEESSNLPKYIQDTEGYTGVRGVPLWNNVITTLETFKIPT